jgi:hypothetical protein
MGERKKMKLIWELILMTATFTVAASITLAIGMQDQTILFLGTTLGLGLAVSLLMVKMFSPKPQVNADSTQTESKS